MSACCLANGIGIVPYRVLHSGILAGVYRRGQALPPDSRKAGKSDWVPELTDELFDKLEAIEALAGKAGMSMAHYALAWALSRPAVCSIMMGVDQPGQIEMNIEFLEHPFPADHDEKIEAI